MATRVVYATYGRYVVTEKGRQDLERVPTCQCHIKLTGLLVECEDCGTVYGYTRDSSMASSRSLPKAQ